MLNVEQVSTAYGAVRALDSVSLSVKPGEIVTLIGANGAGKTTMLNTISGTVRQKTGAIAFCGLQIEQTSAVKRVRQGLVQVPEGRQVFANLSVVDNLRLGAYARNDRGINDDLEWAFRLFPRLRERSSQPAGSLSGGEQQMVAIGRALMAKPKLLLLDEPSMGLAPLVVVEIFRILRRLNSETGLSILLVEQNASAALSLSHRAYVLRLGQIVREDAASALLQDPEVQEAFLGKARH
jgi:branched-chain amino acid transport system ATP-binding protein